MRERKSFNFPAAAIRAEAVASSASRPQLVFRDAELTKASRICRTILIGWRSEDRILSPYRQLQSIFDQHRALPPRRPLLGRRQQTDCKVWFPDSRELRPSLLMPAHSGHDVADRARIILAAVLPLTSSNRTSVVPHLISLNMAMEKGFDH